MGYFTPSDPETAPTGRPLPQDSHSVWEFDEAVMSSMGEGLYTVDTQGLVTSINPAAEELFGWSRSELLGKKMHDMTHYKHPDGTDFPSADCPGLQVLREGGILRDQEDVFIRKDGTFFNVVYSSSPLRAGDKIVGLVVVFRDVSESKRMEEHLVKNSKLESIGILAGGIAHDFNNILSAIIGNLSLAKIYIGPEHKGFHKVEESQKAALRGKSLTQQLLTFSKGGTPIKKTLPVGELLKEWVEFSLQGTKVRCELSIQEGLWTVEADEGQLNQVVTNLVLNAHQAGPEEASSIHVQAVNQSLKPGEFPLAAGHYVRIQVTDRGSGISPENLAKVFDPFFSTKPNGSGLGLTTAYWIVKRHQGDIFINSRPGIGTTVSVYIPRSQKQAPQEKEPVKEGLIRGSGRILFMDDETAIREIARETVSQLGYQVKCAQDGLEAIEIFQKARETGQPFDVVILDLTVRAGVGGKDAIRRLCEIDPNVKAIVSSGYSNDPVLANFKDYGFVGRIAKPYTIENLSMTLAQIFRKTDETISK